jgi:CMP/dCMP kinase
VADGDDITWDIRSKIVDENVSVVSAYPSVREALKDQQRRIAGHGRVVMVGRDIGTVIVPDADLKLFITASDEERALRRYRQLAERGAPPPLETVLADVRYRDRFDSTRAVAPLKAAPDAVVIDTTGRSIIDVMALVEELLRERGFLDGC